MSRVDASTVVFFDASCLIAASALPAGGSEFLWSLRERRLLVPAVSQAVLWETEANLTRKFPAHCLTRHWQQLTAGAPLMAVLPRLDVSPRLYPAINEKDEHVVAGAIAIGASFILTLDRGLERDITAASLAVLASAPGDFIKSYLPRHPDCNNLRE